MDKMADEQIKVFTLEDLKKASEGHLIPIPGFEPNSTIYVRVKRIDITADMLGSSVLPNELQQEVVKQFDGNTGKKKPSQKEIEVQIAKRFEEESSIADMIPMIDKMCRKALLEPTYEQFEELYPLTTSQKMTIFQWLMEEVKSMRGFRSES